MTRTAALMVGAFTSAIASCLFATGVGAQPIAPPTAPPPQPMPGEVIILHPVAPEPPPPHDPNSSFSFSTGYARLDTSGNSIVDNVDGWYFDTDFAFRLKPASPLWAGISLT